MKKLKLGFIGEFPELYALSKEASDLGHDIIILDSIDKYINNLDYIFCFEDRIEKINVDTFDKFIIVNKNHVILLNDRSEGYLLNDEQQEVDIDCLIDIIISISKEQINLNKKIFLEQAEVKINTENEILPEGYEKSILQFPDNKCIHELFEHYAALNPKNIAIVCEDRTLSYAELNAKANQLAHYLLINHNIQIGSLIGLCFDRSEQIIIGILAVLKLGAAYIPIDPTYPADRIAYILADTRTHIVLCNQEYDSKFSDIITKNKLAINLELIDRKSLTNYLETFSNENIPLEIANKNLAYIIYTSGTTGQPKGVMIEHKSVINLMQDLIQRYNMQSSDKVLLFANYVFDASVEQIFLTLLSGAQLYICNEDTRSDSNLLESYCIQHQITHLHITPTYAAILGVNNLPSLRRLVLGGDVVPFELFQQLSNQSFLFINEYGPTETCITALLSINENHIGKPIANTTVYVLDTNLNPVPINVTGELYIGGAGLARGYLNLPELTDECFIVNPFQTENEKLNNRLYKTGDQVCYLPDGNIKYIGRNDFQVKINGYRIELGEIESKLASYPEVKQAVVLAPKNQENIAQYLVGYYTSDQPLDESTIITYLNSQLPAYMVPTVLVWIDKLPITRNGKLDRKALPIPLLSDVSHYVPPRNDLERKICETYAKVLNLPVEQVGIQDDFFRLGGNSIIVVKLINRLNHPDIGLKKTLGIADIFNHRTIQKLIDHLSIQANNEVIVIPKIHYSEAQIKNGLDKIAPLSFGQERLWLIDRFRKSANAYNVPFLKQLSPRIDISLLKEALKALIARHEVLHSLIKIDSAGNGYQEVIDLNFLPLLIRDHKFSIKAEMDEFITNEVNHIFNLDKEYAIRLHILEDSATGNKHFLMVAHHIAIDGWSLDIFKRDLQTFYDYYLALQDDRKHHRNLAQLNIPDLDIQFRDYSIWERNYLSQEKLAPHIQYWRKKLADYEELNLPLDNPRPSQFTYDGGGIPFNLDQETTRKLKNLSKKQDVSLYNILVAGLNLSLRSFCNQDDIVIGTNIANRHYQQIENLIGCIVNIVPLRSQINPNITLASYLKEVSQTVIEAQAHQHLPFEKLCSALNIPREKNRHPLFQVVFAMQSFYSHPSDTKNELFLPTNLPLNYTPARVDIALLINDSGLEISGIFWFYKIIFEQETIRKLIETFQFILKQLADTPFIYINELCLHPEF